MTGRFGVGTGANVSPVGDGESSDFFPAVKSTKMAGALVLRPAWAWARRDAPCAALGAHECLRSPGFSREMASPEFS